MLRYLTFPILLLLASSLSFAQNISGLLNKKLNKIDDVGSVLESGIGALLGGGKIKGSIDSVIVLNDGEHDLQLKIYYTGFENAFLKVQASNAQKQKQEEIVKSETQLATTSTPIICSLTLKPDLTKGLSLESPFLKVEITKDNNKPGQVVNYSLNKQWKIDLDPQNVVINIKPQPIGSAGTLHENEVKDGVPAKQIIFDASRLYYTPKVEAKVNTHATEIKATNYRSAGSVRMATGPQRMHLFFKMPFGILSDDISGTWANGDANTTGITKLIISNNQQVQVFGKCSPTDCDWGKVALSDLGNNSFRSEYNFSFKKTHISISHTGDQLTVVEQNQFSDNRGATAYTYIFRKNAAVNTVLMTQKLSIKEYAVFQSRNPAPAVDYSAKGADNKPIYLWGDLKSDIDIEKPQDISNINMNIFPDKNPASGVYYFLPADYHLRYENRSSPEKGYNLSILYGSSTDSSDAPVHMSAKLTSGISTREISFIKTLLKASIPSAKELRIMPLRENPAFSFQSYLTSQYNIPQNNISVQSSTDLSNDIRVDWQTDAPTKEFIQTALTSREGLGASVILKPSSETIIDQQIPVTINLADGRTLGKIILDPATWRTKRWQNATPYPLHLKHLNILKLSQADRSPIIYSWSLDEATVPSQAQVSCDPSLVPTWLDKQESVLMWIDYAIEDCKSCDEKVIDAITGGVSSNRSQMVRFTIPPVVFDSLHASYFLVNIRSIQLDPKAENIKESGSILKITKANDKDFTAGPLFIPTGGSLSYEYKITMATDDGEFREMGKWISATENEILLGKTKLRELFSATE
ncbi:MAG: hypothetical protein ABI415_03515 [Flavitalea sp.]